MPLGLAALLACALVPAAAAPAATGGAAGPLDSAGAGTSGGTEYVGEIDTSARPVLREFRVARRVRAGRVPRVVVRIDHAAASALRMRITFDRLRSRRAVSVPLGVRPANRRYVVRWPKGVKLRAGEYAVRLHAVDADGHGLVRAKASGKATVKVVRAPKAKPRPRPRPKPKPRPRPRPIARPKRNPAPPVVRGGGVFPVRGPYSLGGAGSRFGAGRPGHRHQGQDIAGAPGLPVVTPTGGTVAFTDVQKGGAGYYVVVDASNGNSYFFAHCQARSFTVRRGQRIAAGTQVCRLGNTGSSTGPHLHFEIWVGGWRHRGGRPIDPLPQLRAWAR